MPASGMCQAGNWRRKPLFPRWSPLNITQQPAPIDDESLTHQIAPNPFHLPRPITPSATLLYLFNLCPSCPTRGQRRWLPSDCSHQQSKWKVIKTHTWLRLSVSIGN